MKTYGGKGKEEKKFVTIDLEEKPKEKEAIVLSEEPLRVKKPVKREEKKEFEFSPVISPIFGSSEEESKPKKKSAAPLPQRSKKNPWCLLLKMPSMKRTLLLSALDCPD